jgi:hypothetical protein
VAEPVHKRTTGVTTPAKSPSQAEKTGLSRKFGADDGRHAAITPRAMRVTTALVNNTGYNRRAPKNARGEFEDTA